MKDNTKKGTSNMVEDETLEIDAEIDYKGLMYALLENAKRIIAGAIIGLLIAGGYSFFLAKPVYEASCKLYVVSNGDSAINLSDLQIGSYLTSDFVQVFDAWEVKEQVLQNLDLSYSYEDLSKMLKVTNPSDTRILNVTVTSNDPVEATSMANEYARVASEYISDTMAMDKPSVLSSALEPVDPVRPRKIYNMALGLIAGGMIVALFVVVCFLLDNKIKNAEDILRYAGMDTLAIVPSSEMYSEKDVLGYGGGKQRYNA